MTDPFAPLLGAIGIYVVVVVVFALLLLFVTLLVLWLDRKITTYTYGGLIDRYKEEK